ncbi:MAG TPA: hypothetical protein VF266_24950 [Thermoanaerobaculia bacterium]
MCLVAAGYALWRLWAVIARRGMLFAVIVALGFAARSFAGQGLFWVSYLKLPYGRSLQLGDGLWFFGLDALHYYVAARSAALQGLGSVLTVSHYVPSVVYVKVMGLFLWLFGIATSTAILLNLFTYLGTCALIIICAERRRVDRRITALTLGAICFLPSTILWSLQPLKDAFVLFLAVLFAFMVDELAAAWRGDGGRARTGRVIFAAVMLAVTTYALAGIRWYYAVIMLAAASIPLLAIIIAARGGRATALRTAAMFVLMIVLAQNVVAGAGPYLPEGMRAMLSPWKHRGNIAQRIGAVTAAVSESRENFDRYKGAGTRIRAGATVAEEEKKKTTATKPKPAQVAAAKPPAPAPAPANPPMQSASAEPPATTTQPPAPPVTATHAPETPHVAKTTPPPASEPKPEPVKSTPALVTKPEPKKAEPVVKKPEPAPAPVTKPAPTTAAPAPVINPAPAVAKPAKPAPVATKTAAPQQQPKGSTQMDVPTTAGGRLITGLAALLLPRKVAAALGLVSIGGGRGLMWFVDLDTILFNAVMIAFATVFFIGLRRGAWRDPFLWYLVVATVVITSALAYTVSNFGTLFRHRQMVVATLALIGIAAARPRPEATAVRSGEAA